MSENQQLEKATTEGDRELEPQDERLAPGELSRTSFNCFGGFGGFGINFRMGLRLQRSVSYDDRRRQSRESSPPSPPYTPTTMVDSKTDITTDAVSCRCKECIRLEQREEHNVSSAKNHQSPSLTARQRRRRSASVGGDDAAKPFPLNGNSRSLDSVNFPPPTSPSSDIQEWWKKRRKMIRKRRNKVKSLLVKIKKNKTTEDTDFVADGILTDRYPDESDSLWWSIREDVRLPN